MKFKILLSRSLRFALSAGMLPALTAHAQLTEVGNIGGLRTGTLGSTVSSVLSAFLWLAGIIAVLYIIYGGVKYIISGGDESKAGEAKRTILYAVIGLIVIGLAAVITNFVIGIAAGTGAI